MSEPAIDAARAARDALRSGWRSAGFYPPITIADAIETGAATCPDDVMIFSAVDGDEHSATLSEIQRGASGLAGRLAAAGIGAGDAVIIQAAADRAGVEALSALWRIGAVVVPVVAGASTDDVAHVAAETGARTAIVPASWRGSDIAAPLAAASATIGLQRVLVLGSEVPSGATALANLPEGVEPDRSGVRPDDVACVLYTSGSTAAPKGVRHTHETMLFGLTVGIGEGRTLVSFPAGHVAAVIGLLRPLCVGGLSVVLDRWSARAAVEAIEAHRITSSSGTPFFLATLLDEAERTGRDIGSLERYLCGAAAVPPALLARSAEAGIVSWRTYGSTEHPGVCTSEPDDAPEKRHHTDGRPVIGTEVRLVDDTGADVAPGEEGQILTRGPKQFIGYQNANLDADAFSGTWFRTGDLGRFDSDGHLVVTDRLKDIVIRGGENISASEVEATLATHPALVESAVIAVPDPLFGEQVCAVVVVRAGAVTPSVEELAGHCARVGLAGHKRPTVLRVIDALPRTTAGKVRKAELRAAERSVDLH